MRKNLAAFVFIVALFIGLSTVRWCPWAKGGKRSLDPARLCPCCPGSGPDAECHKAKRRPKSPVVPGPCNCQKGIIPTGCHSNCPCCGTCSTCKHCGCKNR